MKNNQLKKQSKKYYFNILALNTNTGKNHFFHSLYLTKKNLTNKLII